MYIDYQEYKYWKYKIDGIVPANEIEMHANCPY